MNSDSKLKREIMAALEAEPGLDGSSIAVSVQAGVVGLFGRAETADQVAAIEKATKRTAGVRTLTNEIEVRRQRFLEPDDYEIACTIRSDFSRKAYLGFDRIVVTVRNRTVTLEGEVNWRYQIRLAEQQVVRLGGSGRVVNLLGARSDSQPQTAEEDVIALPVPAARMAAAERRPRLHTSVA
jgi:osmotically-inducible protein OsmY